MRILGIETSCDETAIAIIDIDSPVTSSGDIRVRVLANVISSQAKLHAKFGGVVPNLAKREHQQNLPAVLIQALKKAGLSISKSKFLISKQIPNSKLQENLKTYKLKNLKTILERELELFARMVEYVLPMKTPEIDAIAVTVGPGLAPALWVGVNFARALAYLWDKPLIPVNHLEGHIYASLLQRAERTAGSVEQIGFSHSIRYPLTAIRFPALCLIVSGGHTELVLMRGYGKYRIIGETLDDAAGEAFDKVAKMLGLGFPGGPPISAAAEMEFKVKSLKLKVTLPRPMINSGNFDFSFSGLKTAVLYALRDLTKKLALAKIRPVMAREFQDAVVDVLVAKTIQAAKKFKAETVMIGGGVAANQKLRRDLGAAIRNKLPRAHYLMPDVALTGDNALMIALAGWFNRKNKKAWSSVQAEANLRLT